MREVMSPLLSAESVVTARGFPIVTSLEEDGVVGFVLPNRYGSSLSAVVEFEPMLGLVQISAEIMSMQLPVFMGEDLLHIINALNVEVPGATFTATFATDADDVDDIEVSVSHHLISSEDPEPYIVRALGHLEGALLVALPVIYMFLSQRKVYRMNTAGEILDGRTTLSIAECMSMLRERNVGNA